MQWASAIIDGPTDSWGEVQMRGALPRFDAAVRIIVIASATTQYGHYHPCEYSKERKADKKK
ncbi:MAG TPA: hypothetical protein DCE41_23515 [Cytophagales bacterium]|nr:hypothetical protein [Cytophagales bacterium]